MESGIEKDMILDFLDDRNNNALLYGSTFPSACPYRKCNGKIRLSETNFQTDG
jgi:hypothetical protein